MSISVGSVSLDIVPDASRFDALLRAKIDPQAKKAGAQIGQQIAAQIADGIRRGLGDWPTDNPAKEPARRKGEESAGSFGDAFKGRLKAALADLPKIEIGADSSEADRALMGIRAELQALHDAKIGVDINANDALAKANELKARLDALSASSENIQLKIDTRSASAELDKFLTDTKVKADAAGTTSGKSLGANLSKSAAESAGHGSPLIMAAVAGGILAGGPAVIAAAGVMMGGVAAVIAAQAPEVQQAATNVGHAFEGAFGNAAKVTIPFFVQALNTVRSSAGQLASEAAPAFQALQGPIDSTVQGVVNLAQNAMPGLVAAVKAGGPVFQGLETFLSDVGSGLGSFFTIISQHGAAAGTVFTALGSAMDSILPALGTILGEGAELGSMVLPPLAAVLGVVSNVVQALGPILPEIAFGFAAWKIAGIIGPMLGTLATNIEMAGANAMVAAAGFTESAAAGEALGTGFEVAAAGARGLEAAMGPIGWVLAGISLVMPLFIGNNDSANESQKRLTESTQTLTSALQQSKGAIDDNVRAQAAQTAQKNDLFTYADQIGVSYATMTSAVLGNADALNQVKAASDAAKAGQGDLGMWTGAVKKGFDTSFASVLALSGATKTEIGNQQQLAQAMAGASDAAAINSERLQAVSNAASAANTQIGLFKQGLEALTGKTISADDAQANLTTAVVNAETATKNQTGALVDANGQLNLHSAAGVAAYNALKQVAQASDTVIATMEQQGATTADVNAKDASLRDSFIKTAEKMGFSAGAAQDLANKIYGIPAQRKTEILADTNPAQKAIDDFLNSNSSRVLHLKVGAVAADAGPAALARAAGLSGGGLANGGVIPGYAPGVDSVPAMLSPGEGVLVPEAVRGIGGAAAIQAINSTYSNRVQGFANGGVVVGMDADTSPAQSAVNNEVAAAVKLAAKVIAAQANAPGAPSNPSGNAALGKVLAGFQGWGSGPEWNALYALWQRESGWRNTAQNPSSTAYGIPQFLNSTWASLGVAKTSDAATQINAGLKYIGQRFHDPIGAWAHETKFGWYDQGGELPPGPSLVYNGTGAPELVAPKQSFEQVMADASGGSGPASFTGNLYLDSGEFLGVVRGIAQEETASGMSTVRNRLTYNS